MKSACSLTAPATISMPMSERCSTAMWRACSRAGLTTMLSRVEVNLTDTSGKVLFGGVGRNAGLELHGDLDRLLALQVEEAAR